MPKGVSKALRKEIRAVLKEYVSKKQGDRLKVSTGEQSLRGNAERFLEDIGALEVIKGRDEMRITATGREYYDKVVAPRCYWFRQNWFAATVAAATILFSAAVAGVSIADLAMGPTVVVMASPPAP